MKRREFLSSTAAGVAGGIVSGAAVPALPVADGAARLEAGQAVRPADIVALGLQRPLKRSDIGAV